MSRLFFIGPSAGLEIASTLSIEYVGTNFSPKTFQNGKFIPGLTVSIVAYGGVVLSRFSRDWEDMRWDKGAYGFSIGLSVGASLGVSFAPFGAWLLNP